MVGFFSVSLIYRFALEEYQKRQFEKLSQFCNRWIDIIPLSFLLGFYVSVVYQRWWEMFLAIPWPTSLALTTTAHVYGHDDRSRLMRRSILRYGCLAIAMVFSCISPPVRRRFPTMMHFKDAGLLNDNEHNILEGIKTQYPKYFVPLVWSTSIVRRARKEGKIGDDVSKKVLIEKINDIRQGCMMLLNYDWIPIPLGKNDMLILFFLIFFLKEYTQVVTLSVYSYFLAALFGRQFLDPSQKIEGNEIDIYFPVFTSLQFVFYVGWLKVAECLINPFGEDDDDFELNLIIDWNLKLSYLIVDEMHAEHPEMIKDAFWELPSYEVTLPYAPGTEPAKGDIFKGSAAGMEVSTKEAEQIWPAGSNEAGGHQDTADTGSIVKRFFSRKNSTTSKGSEKEMTDLADVVIAHADLHQKGEKASLLHPPTTRRGPLSTQSSVLAPPDEAEEDIDSVNT